MIIKELCPQCGNELRKKAETDYPYVCDNCDKAFYEFEAVKFKSNYTDEDIEAIKQANINITPFSLVLSEEDHLKYIQGGESEIFKNVNARDISNDYILVKHTGKFEFFHYGPLGLTEIKPSVDENEELSFGEGIYCYDAKSHEPVSISPLRSLYKGIYDGDYLECIYDCDVSHGFDKGEGNTKEYLLLTKVAVPVKVIK